MKRLLVVAPFFTAVLACAHAPPKKEVVWPDPPDPPRIRFVQAFRRTEDLDQSGWASMIRTVMGGSRDPSIANPMGVAISDEGERLYIADYGAGRVLVADFLAKRISQFAPDEAVGKPFNVALDEKENVYVTDSSGGVVLVFSKKGDKLRTIGRREIERPTGVVVDRAHRLLYVSDSSRRKSLNHRVRVFDLDGKWLRDLGVKPGEETKGDADGQFYFPTYLALDSEGSVYVADTMNFRVQVFAPDGTFLGKHGENGDGPGTFAQLKGIDLDSFGNVYVVDGGHSNVQIFNKKFQPLMFFGGYAKKLEYFDLPSGIAIDRTRNRIYVCNEFISRINVYELINTKAEDSLPVAARSDSEPKPATSQKSATK